MKKKIVLLIGIVVLSGMFLFIKPIKAETEVVGVIPSDDAIVCGIWDRDAFFLHAWGGSIDPKVLLFGYQSGYSDFKENRIYLKFDLPSKPTMEIVSIRLRFWMAIYFESDIIPQFDWNISIELVSNNWDENNINWTDGRPEYLNETLETAIEDVYGGSVYRYIDLTYFKDSIENNTFSIQMIGSQLLNPAYENPRLLEGYMGFYSKEGFDPGNDVNPYLIVEYEDRRPPQPFTLTSNADNPDTDGKFRLEWTESGLSDTYSVYQNDSPLGSGLTELYYDIENRVNGYYTFKVIGFNEFGNISSNEIFVNISIPPPSQFTLTSDAGNPDKDGVFTLHWSSSENTNTYSVYQDGFLLKDGLTELYYNIRIYTNESYAFEVIAFNEYGNRSSNEITVIVEISPPPKPSPFMLTSNVDNPDTDGIFTLYWTISQYADSYSVYQNDILVYGGTTALQYIMTVFDDGSHIFKIMAINDYGNITSNEITVNIKILERPPLPFTLTSNADSPDTDGLVMLYWSNSEYAKSYSIYQDGILLDYGITELYYNVKIYADGSYNFKVIALNDYGQVESNEITIHVEIPVVQPQPEPEIPEQIRGMILGYEIAIIILSIGLAIVGLAFARKLILKRKS